MVSYPRSRRLFVPLKTRPFREFAEGRKTWELRKRTGQFSKEQVEVGRVVELRKGYDTGNSIWGVIEGVMIGDDVAAIFEQVPYQEIVPAADSKGEAHARIAEHYSESPKEGFICFEVSKAIRYFEVTEEQHEALESGQIDILVVHGNHNQLKGPCVLIGPQPPDIPAIVTGCCNTEVQELSQSTVEAAGYSSIRGLLAQFESDSESLCNSTPVAIVEVELLPH